MSIDASIPLAVNPPATVNVAQTMGHGLALRQAFEQAKQDAQDRQDQQAAQQTIAQSGGNLDTAIQTLYQRGLARPAMALEAVRAKRQKDAGDLLKTTLGNEAERYNVVSKAANGITDQASQDATIARLKATDPQTADVMAQTLGPTYNPDNVTKAQTISLNAKDSADMKHQAAIAYQESQKTSQDGVKFLSSMLAGTPQEHWDTVYQHAPSFVGPDVIKTVQGMVQTPEQAKALAIGPQKDTEDKVQSAEIEAIKAFTAANGRKPNEKELDQIHRRFKEAGTIVRVNTGTGPVSTSIEDLAKSAGMNVDALKRSAGIYHETRDITGFGMAGKAQKLAIMNAEAMLYPDSNIAASGAQFKADQSSLKNSQAILDSIQAFHPAAIANLKQFDTLFQKIPDTGSPFFNSPVRSLDRSLFGADNVLAAQTAVAVATREIARITSNPKLTGQLSDSARQEVENFLPKDATLKEARDVMAVLKNDLDNVEKGQRDQLKKIQFRLQNPGKEAPEEQPKQTGAPEQKPIPGVPGGVAELRNGRWIRVK